VVALAEDGRTLHVIYHPPFVRTWLRGYYANALHKGTARDPKTGRLHVYNERTVLCLDAATRVGRCIVQTHHCESWITPHDTLAVLDVTADAQSVQLVSLQSGRAMGERNNKNRRQNRVMQANLFQADNDKCDVPIDFGHMSLLQSWNVPASRNEIESKHVYVSGCVCVNKTSVHKQFFFFASCLSPVRLWLTTFYAFQILGPVLQHASAKKKTFFFFNTRRRARQKGARV
jgi:hypothetical protein